LVAECGVVAAVIVGVQPGGKGVKESLHSAVGLRSIGSGRPMLDVARSVGKGLRSITGTVVNQHLSCGSSYSARRHAQQS
jgi:hypothetical protein